MEGACGWRWGRTRKMTTSCVGSVSCQQAAVPGCGGLQGMPRDWCCKEQRLAMSHVWSRIVACTSHLCTCSRVRRSLEPVGRSVTAAPSQPPAQLAGGHCFQRPLDGAAPLASSPPRWDSQRMPSAASPLPPAPRAQLGSRCACCAGMAARCAAAVGSTWIAARACLPPDCAVY